MKKYSVKKPHLAKMPHKMRGKVNRPKFATEAKPVKEIVKSYKPKKH